MSNPSATATGLLGIAALGIRDRTIAKGVADMGEREELNRTLLAASLARRNDERLAAAVGLQPATPGTTVARDPVDLVACRIGDASCASAHAGVLRRSKRLDGAGVQQSLLRLQRYFGNQYVGRILSRVGSEGEQAQDMTAIERSIDSARGGGHGMDHGTRARMEAAFGADFSDVRIHTDAKSDSLNRSLAARAFTTGRDVFFRHGEYSPGSSSGRELLAHELTHVVQQNGDGLQRKMTVSEPGDPYEVEADQMASAVIQQEQMQAVGRAVTPLDEENLPEHLGVYQRSASCHGGTTLCRDPNL